MAADDDFVIVPKELFNYLRQHCEHCPDFSDRLQDLSSAADIHLVNLLRKSEGFYIDQSLKSFRSSNHSSHRNHHRSLDHNLYPNHQTLPEVKEQV